jgi:hypothetical protein
MEGAEALRGDDEVEVEVEQESESEVGAEAPSDDDEGCAATLGGTHPAPRVATEAEGLARGEVRLLGDVLEVWGSN